MFPIVKDDKLEDLPYRKMYQKVQGEFPELDEQDWRNLALLRTAAIAQRRETLRQVRVTLKELNDIEQPQRVPERFMGLLDRALNEEDALELVSS